jgi:NhaA family Na+:H+ antiporter
VRAGQRLDASRLEDALHPVSAFFVLPVFALANAGLYLGGGQVGRAFSDRVTWAVAAALVIGKPLGVAGAALLATRLRVGRLPEGVTAGSIVGVGLLAGIGFTVSLLVADAAFAGNAASDHAKLGVLAGSLLAGVGGAIVLAAVGRRRQASSKTRTLPV